MSKVKMLRPCGICGERVATDKHHKFPQHKENVKAYGRKLIDADFNILPACNHCHASHRNVPGWAMWDEMTFRLTAEEYGYKVGPGTKSFQNFQFRFKKAA